jgi:VanZ family protein
MTNTKPLPLRKAALIAAILWTLMILLGCFAPAKEIPQVDVPMMDKWVHFVMFGGFTFLWSWYRSRTALLALAVMLLIGVALGATIELLQGYFVSLGRACEFLDAVADSIGALLGLVLFYFVDRVVKR